MTDLDAGLAKIWETRRPLIEQRLVAIEKAVALSGASCPSELRIDAATSAHLLAGSMGAFGLGDASNLAREAENHLRKEHMTIADSDRLRELARLLRVLIEQGLTPK